MGALLAGVAACTVHKQETPSLGGPSEFGKSLVLSVNPDVLSQDGQSQSVISIDARDSNGSPLRNVALRTDVSVNGAVSEDAQHVGSLSARSLVTDGSGHASVVYTAPRLQSGFPIALGLIQILVTPQEGDFGNSTPRAVSLKLVLPPGVGGPAPSGSLVAKFTANPTTPTEDQVVLFDASSSTTTGAAIINYSWDFGDRRPGASGLTATHSYGDAGTFVATLTITDAVGGTASSSQSLVVGQGAEPTATFTTSPATPLPSQPVFFNASASRPATGRSIVSYSWDFGDGSPAASGIQTSHVYTVNGTYKVTLTVTDDAGHKGTFATDVPVGDDTPTAVFTFLPAAPTAGTTVAFNATGSSAVAGRTISSYTWSFGDGGTGSGPTPSHPYALAGVYNVTLTVVDSQGKSKSTTTQLTVLP